MSAIAHEPGSTAIYRDAELQRIFALQRGAFRREPYAPLAVRRDRLRRLIDLLYTHQDEICAAVAADYGRRSAFNTKLFDILPPLNALKYAMANVEAWMRPLRRSANFPYNLTGGRARVQFVPLGVVGNISPWNFPITLALGPLGGMLAAGNRVMLKPSELTPQTSATLQDLIARQFAQDEIAVVTGGVDVAIRFANLPFDHLLFTGSTEVGRRVAASAAHGLVPITLELGGKSPVLVGRSASLGEVAAKVVLAKTLNAGQVCLAPDYLLVHESQREELIAAMRATAAALYPDGAASADFVNIISERHAQRLHAHLADALARGNRVIPLFEGPHALDPRCFTPHLVVIEGNAGTLMDEEIFGPVLPIIGVGGIDEALERIAARPPPLAAYYFGSDAREIERVTKELACGSVVVGDLMSQFLQDDLPFGGVGESGMGSYHGREGFERFSHAKAVFRPSKLIDIGRLVRPPYGERIKRLLKFQIKR
jgi:coniferyl-aldehyde dehydrogenase